MTYNEIKKWLEDNNYQNSGLRTDRNHRVNLYLSDVLYDFAQQQIKNLNVPTVIKSLSDLDGKTIPVFFTVKKGQSNIHIDII